MEDATVQPAMSDEEVTTAVVGTTVVKALVMVISLALDKGARAAKDNNRWSLHRPMLLNIVNECRTTMIRSEVKGYRLLFRSYLSYCSLRSTTFFPRCMESSGPCSRVILADELLLSVGDVLD